MISERLFVRRYLSFWRDVIPFGEAFVRGINASLKIPIAQDSSWGGEPGRRSVLAVTAAEAFELEETADAAILQRFGQVARRLGVELQDDLFPYEYNELRRSVQYLTTVLDRPKTSFRPSFAGCGIVSSCEGDYLTTSVLYEMKSGWHAFRLVDVRQLLTYCALNHASKEHAITAIGLLNPRIGRHVTINIDDAAEQLAGSSATEMLERITHFMQEGALSGL